MSVPNVCEGLPWNRKLSNKEAPRRPSHLLGTRSGHSNLYPNQRFGQTGSSGFIPEDVNCDGTIDVLDMITTVQQFWN